MESSLWQRCKSGKTTIVVRQLTDIWLVVVDYTQNALHTATTIRSSKSKYRQWLLPFTGVIIRRRILRSAINRRPVTKLKIKHKSLLRTAVLVVLTVSTNSVSNDFLQLQKKLKTHWLDIAGLDNVGQGQIFLPRVAQHWPVSNRSPVTSNISTAREIRTGGRCWAACR